MKTTVWLARHGETPWAAEDRYNGQQNTPLTERGRAQAQRLAERLKREKVQGVLEMAGPHLERFSLIYQGSGILWNTADPFMMEVDRSVGLFISV